MLVYILIFIGILISIYKAYLDYTKPDIKSYFWYQGPKIYGWQTNEICQFSEKDPQIWRSVSRDMINGNYRDRGK